MKPGTIADLAQVIAEGEDVTIAVADEEIAALLRNLIHPLADTEVVVGRYVRPGECYILIRP